MKRKTTRGPRAKLRERLKAHAWGLLAKLSLRLAAPVTARAGNRQLTVTVTVSPADVAPATAGADPGRHFSPIERLLVNAVRAAKAAHPDRPLMGKQIAAAVGYEYGTKVRVLLANLVEREALVHDEEGRPGYDIATGARS